ncbi:ribonuclease P protein subunit p29-like [Anneissia japonica]|uniref:ribonuclease P protein subunit p29-like n=1 Tax=Anneissia japonica TaxID=1529436 RepID=UPI00142592A8|nr:ribonuclease P protein subunit p29-like [Anneissia japonica]
MSGNVTASDFYRGLSQNIRLDHDVDIQEAEKPKKFVRSFMTQYVPQKCHPILEEVLTTTRVAVDVTRTSKRKGKSSKGRQKRLSSKQRKALKLFDIPKEQQRYDMYIPLHQLWLDYIKEYMQTHLVKQDMKQFEAKLLKADLHGCILTVTKSKCPSYIGLSGILLQETRHLFKIVTKEDKLKSIPKGNSVFTYEFCGHVVDIFGNQFKQKSSQRSARRFKTKPTIDL